MKQAAGGYPWRLATHSRGRERDPRAGHSSPRASLPKSTYTLGHVASGHRNITAKCWGLAFASQLFDYCLCDQGGDRSLPLWLPQFAPLENGDDRNSSACRVLS